MPLETLKGHVAEVKAEEIQRHYANMRKPLKQKLTYCGLAICARSSRSARSKAARARDRQREQGGGGGKGTSPAE